MDAWQMLSLALVAVLVWLYWRERSKRLRATSDRDRAMLAMAQLKTTDETTGLLCPEAFDKALDQAAQRVDHSGGSFTVLRISMDNFGLIQDGFGEEFGHHFLTTTAQRLQALAGREASLGMLSNQDFVALLSGGATVGALLAERLQPVLGQPIESGGNKAHTHCSIGIASYPDHGARARILGCTELAMRSLRHSGGGGYCVYDPKMAVQAREEAMLVNELRQAAGAGQFELYYQPKIDASSLQVTAAEALLRWHHPTRGLVSPTIFIPLAEKYGLMGEIGNWVIAQACQTAGEWLKVGLRMRVAVNISGYQMRQDDLVENIEQLLQRHGVQADRFTCEITETVAMEDTQATKRAFEKMQRAGLHVSIDDFGTGYSSLGSLRKLPAAELKIDRAFVADLEESEEARSIAKSIIDMARALHMRVIAEGVETTGQSNILAAMGCDEMQGFLFSMPITASELQQLAQQRPGGDGAGFRNSLFASDFVRALDR